MRKGLVAVLAVCAVASAQEEGLVLRTETRVVQIDVQVKSANGQPADLTKENFTVRDEGKARPIQIFSLNRSGADTAAVDTGKSRVFSPMLAPNVFTNHGAPAINPAGHSTVILLDHINSWFDNAAYARQGVIDLMKKVPADERIAIYVMARGLGLAVLQEYTTDRPLLLRAITKYIPRAMDAAPPGPGSAGDGVNEVQLSSRDQASALEFGRQRDAEEARLALKTLADTLAIVPGRKSVFYMTQGFPPRQIRAGKDAWDKTIHALNEANVAVNTVDTNGLNGPIRRQGAGGIATMQEIAERTGGTAYYNRNDLDGALAEGIRDSRMTYTLGFYLADTERDDKFHSLKVTVNRPGLELFYRQGYFAGTDSQMEKDKKHQEIESAILSPVNSTAVEMVATIQKRPGTPRGELRVVVMLDPNKITMKPKAEKWVGKLKAMFLQQDDNGKPLSQVMEMKDLTLTKAGFANFQKRGGKLPVETLPLVAQATRLTIVVQDVETGRIGSLTVPLDQVKAAN